MKERGILFSGPMVRAILEGRKTQTRRLIRWKQHAELPVETMTEHGGFAGQPENEQSWSADHAFSDTTRPYKRHGGGIVVEQGIRCPYGLVGERLWIRETWGLANVADDRALGRKAWIQVGYQADREFSEEIERPPEEVARYYAALGREMKAKGDDGDGDPTVCRWRSGIHLPRWAARIVLEVVEVRAERLLTIGEDEARAEGMEFHDGGGVGHSGWRHSRDYGVVTSTARGAFATGWDLLNAKRAPWKSNPWVWVVTFRRAK